MKTLHFLFLTITLLSLSHAASACRFENGAESDQDQNESDPRTQAQGDVKCAQSHVVFVKVLRDVVNKRLGGMPGAAPQVSSTSKTWYLGPVHELMATEFNTNSGLACRANGEAFCWQDGCGDPNGCHLVKPCLLVTDVECADSRGREKDSGLIKTNF